MVAVKRGSVVFPAQPQSHLSRRRNTTPSLVLPTRKSGTNISLTVGSQKYYSLHSSSSVSVAIVRTAVGLEVLSPSSELRLYRKRTLRKMSLCCTARSLGSVVDCATTKINIKHIIDTSRTLKLWPRL